MTKSGLKMNKADQDELKKYKQEIKCLVLQTDR